MRDGKSFIIPAEEPVPGDVVHIRVGNTVPTGLKIIESMNFETDEALLTGESLPVIKNHTIR